VRTIGLLGGMSWLSSALYPAPSRGSSRACEG
jgi:aspartate/glutamate racemase